jgi:hypothetical protein
MNDYLKILKESKDRHFCTAELLQTRYTHKITSTKVDYNYDSTDELNTTQPNESNSTLIICENYPASYQSKNDQINAINDDIRKLRESKAILRQTLKQIDSVLQDPDCSADKSRPKTVHPYFNVIPLVNQLPVLSDKRPKTSTKTNDSKRNTTLKSSIFDHPFNRSTFTDKVIHDHEKNVRKVIKKARETSTIDNSFEPSLS